MSNLKTLDEHNRDSLHGMPAHGPAKNGIACPKCGAELFDSDPMTMLLTEPPQKCTHCDCGYKGCRYV